MFEGCGKDDEVKKGQVGGSRSTICDGSEPRQRQLFPKRTAVLLSLLVVCMLTANPLNWELRHLRKEKKKRCRHREKRNTTWKSKGRRCRTKEAGSISKEENQWDNRYLNDSFILFMIVAVTLVTTNTRLSEQLNRGLNESRFTLSGRLRRHPWNLRKSISVCVQNYSGAEMAQTWCKAQINK